MNGCYQVEEYDALNARMTAQTWARDVAKRNSAKPSFWKKLFYVFTGKKLAVAAMLTMATVASANAASGNWEDRQGALGRGGCNEATATCDIDGVNPTLIIQLQQASATPIGSMMIRHQMCVENLVPVYPKIRAITISLYATQEGTPQLVITLNEQTCQPELMQSGFLKTSGQ